jgi:hypothetical protein
MLQRGGKPATPRRESFFQGHFSIFLLVTIGFSPFVERDVTLTRRVFPLDEAFTERKLLAMASRHRCTGEGVFVESTREPSRWRCAERPIWLSANGFS